MQTSYFRVIFTAKKMFQRLIRLFTHPYFIKNSSQMLRKEEWRVYIAGEIYHEVSFCVRHLKHQDFLVAILLLFKGNRTDWNPDTIMSVQPPHRHKETVVKSVTHYSTVNVTEIAGWKTLTTGWASLASILCAVIMPRPEQRRRYDFSWSDSTQEL